MRWVVSDPTRAGQRDRRHQRLIGLLLAAARQAHYRRILAPLGLSSERAIRGIPCPERILALLPPSTLPWPAEPRERLRFEAPPGVSRVAVLERGFQETRGVRCFREDAMGDLNAYQPEVIAGPADTLTGLARAVRAGRMTLPLPQRFLCVFTGLREGCLPEPARDLLWEVFQAPVFEQWRPIDGTLAAEECEAHAGLHVRSADAVIERDTDGCLLATSLEGRHPLLLRARTGWTAQLEPALCGCGRPGLRLVGLEPLRRTMSKAAALAKAASF